MGSVPAVLGGEAVGRRIGDASCLRHVFGSM
jgi:hypothetical protein